MSEEINHKEIKEYIGKKLLTIMTLDTSSESLIKDLNAITKITGYSVEDIKLLLFEDNTALVFVDYDCDGYRSGNWNIISIGKVLKHKMAKEIKNINSKVTNIEFENIDEQDNCLITTEEYLISMGQDRTDSYYPSNFFNIEECKKHALQNLKLIK